MPLGLHRFGARSDRDVHQTFGKYRLVRRLATGGMGELFLGTVHGEAGFVKKVVIKRLHPDLNNNHELVQMLIDEARITSQLFHSNICQVLDLGIVPEDGGHFIAMEYIDGPDLDSLSKRATGGFELEAALFVVSEVLAGLHYAHSCEDVDGTSFGIVHRDISPQNVLISREGEVKIIDFGIAKARNRLVRTSTGVIKGKYCYMSPEQALGMPVDHRSDLYAVGLVLYELLRGESPYAGLTHVEILSQIGEPKIDRLDRYRADVSRGLSRIVERAIACSPADRFQSAEELRTALLEHAPRRRYGRPDLARYLQRLLEEGKVPLRRTRGGSSRTVRDPDVPGTTVVERPRPSDTVPDTSDTSVETKPISLEEIEPSTVRLRRRWLPALLMLALFGLTMGYSNKTADSESPRTVDLDRPVAATAVAATTVAAPRVDPPPEPTPPRDTVASRRTRPRRASVVRVGSRPPGARIKLCGRLVRQRTPARLRLRAGRRCSLELKLPGYRNHLAVVEAGQPTVNIELTPEVRRGKLRVISVHEAVVLVDGRRAGLAPGAALSLAEGRHMVQLHFKALRRRSSPRAVNVTAGETAVVRFDP
jgi:serine/threonine protein kinase